MLEKIIKLLENKKNVFLSGGAGTGKSYTTTQIMKYFTQNKKNVIALGSTGISAVNIGGLTIHSFFRFGLCGDLNELAAQDKKQKNALKETYKIISKLDLLIIDEISMISASLLEMIALRLKLGAFSGALLFVGDFFQLAPIANKKENSLFSGYYAFESMAWGEFGFNNFLLTSSKRTANKDFYQMLETLRHGHYDAKIASFLNSRICAKAPKDLPYLFGINAKVNALNQARLAGLNSTPFVCEAQIKISDEKLNQTALEKWLNSLSLPQSLELKIGCEVMFCANKRGQYYNGQRGTLVGQKDDFLYIQNKQGEIIELEKMSFELNEYIEEDGEILAVPRASFTQYPLRLAYALSIHKSQGMSLEAFVCDINDIFAPGQLYVALSRAISPASMFLLFAGRNLEFHLQKSIKIHNSVEKFYENSSFIKEEQI